MKAIVVTLTFEKSTKNKHVFSHPDLGGFYLPKEQVGNPVPKTLKATFEAPEGESSEPEM